MGNCEGFGAKPKTKFQYFNPWSSSRTIGTLPKSSRPSGRKGKRSTFFYLRMSFLKGMSFERQISIWRHCHV